jgi:hypothetical protein
MDDRRGGYTGQSDVPGADGGLLHLGTACIAAGTYSLAGGKTRTLAESWNGSAWAAQTPSNPAGALLSATLRGVSCITPSICTAAGYYEPVSGESKTLAERYDVDSVTEYALAPWGSGGPRGITSGPDGNLWFTMSGSDKDRQDHDLRHDRRIPAAVGKRSNRDHLGSR